MSGREHRRSSGRHVDPRLFLLAAFLLGVLVAAAVAGVLVMGSDDSETSASEPTPTSGAPSTAPATPSESPPASPLPEDVQRALQVKPLNDLEPGDRVVYNATACRFQSWVTDAMEVAVIGCPGEEPFQAKTVFLVPVEPMAD